MSVKLPCSLAKRTHWYHIQTARIGGVIHHPGIPKRAARCWLQLVADLAIAKLRAR